MKQLLVEKYRPKTLDTFVFQNKDNERKIRKWIETKEVPNLLLVSGSGTGKSTLSRIIVKELEIDPSDVKYVNASIESGIGFIREELTPWLRKASFSDIKLVQLEEADRLSIDAQKALRQVTEDFSDRVRFIATANYPKKIDPALHSRFQTLQMDAMNKEAIIDFVVTIIEEEGIEVNDVQDVQDIIDRFAPDIRKIINTIDECTDSNKILHSMSSLDSISDEEEWENLWSGDSPVELEDALNLTHLVDMNNFESFYEVMYNNHDKLPDVTKGIILISKYLDRAKRCSNQKLHLDACLYHIFLMNDESE
jgi:DNA polymerase III delta prime subunit